jgi:peptidoglycan/LPS O-acetylase OafA/YrhL
MTSIGSVSRGRNNNFNLIRMLAAVAVLISHAWPISLGPHTEEPLEALLGYSLGEIAVYIFFSISGFLISASFDRSNSWRDFAAARFLRLFPALAVSITLVSLILGPLVSSLPLLTYLEHVETRQFLLHNLTLFSPRYNLPGVFETNPYPAIEGSIWTLIYETFCYVALFVVGSMGFIRWPLAFIGALGVYFLFWVTPGPIDLRLSGQIENLRQLSLPFVTGSAFYVFRNKIPLTFSAAFTFIVISSFFRDMSLFPIFLTTTLTYLVLWLAFMPITPLQLYNRLGDYSYGTYLYAFPVQGLVIWLFGPMCPLSNVALSFPLVLSLSILSWHLVERPSLTLRFSLRL